MAGRIWTAVSRLGRFIVRLWPISRDEDEALKELAGFYPGPNSIDQEQAADD